MKNKCNFFKDFNIYLRMAVKREILEKKLMQTKTYACGVKKKLK